MSSPFLHFPDFFLSLQNAYRPPIVRDSRTLQKNSTSQTNQKLPPSPSKVYLPFRLFSFKTPYSAT